MDVARPRPLRTALSRRLLAAIAASALAAGAAALFARAPSLASAGSMPLVDRASVWTDRVRQGDLLRQVPAQGTLVPEHVQWLSAATAARVARIVVRAGGQVEPDTVVLVLENPDLELAALEAERQAANAEALLIQLDVKTDAEEKLEESTLAGLRSDARDAERRAGAADRLAPQGLLSELDRRDALEKAQGLGDRLVTEEARRTVLERGRGRQIAAARAELARLRDIAAFRRGQLAALEVRAGVRGVVQDVPLENGQWVAIGTVLAKVAEPDGLKADVKVAEANAKDVHPGLDVRFESPNGNFRGRVSRVDPAVVAGSVRVEVALGADLPRGARADQTVSGYVEIEKLPNVLLVTRPAGAAEDSTMTVFRLDADRKRASRATARLGRGSAHEIEVMGGLAAGDEIVVSDTSAWDGAPRIRLE